MLFKTKELKRIIEVCGNFIDKKTTMPVLLNVLVEKDGNNAIFKATNLNKSVIYKVKDCAVEQSMLLPYKVMEAFLKTSSAEDISIEMKGQLIVVKAGKTKVECPVAEVQDFPHVENKSSASYSKIDWSVIAKNVGKVKVSVAKNNVNKTYNGILFAKEDSNMVLMSTDIHRISLMCIKDFPFQDGAGIVILPEHIDDITNTFGNEKELNYVYEGSDLRIEKDDIFVKIRCARNEMPNYKAVVGNYYKIDENPLVNIPKHEFANIVKKMLALNQEECPVVAIDCQNNQMKIESKTQLNMKIEDEIVLEEPAVYKISVNGKFLNEVLSAMTTGKELSIIKENGDLRPLHIVSREDNVYYNHLLMPLRV